MSEENVGIVRRGFEAWNAGDMKAFRDLYATDVTLTPVKDWPEPGPYLGRDAVIRWFEQLREAWDADALEPISDFIDAGDKVLLGFIWRGLGQGPESNMEFTGVWTVRNNKIARIDFFWDRAEALESAGLSE